MVEANRFYSFSLKGSLSQLFAVPVFYESQYDGDLLYGEYENNNSLSFFYQRIVNI